MLCLARSLFVSAVPLLHADVYIPPQYTHTFSIPLICARLSLPLIHLQNNTIVATILLHAAACGHVSRARTFETRMLGCGWW